MAGAGKKTAQSATSVGAAHPSPGTAIQTKLAAPATRTGELADLAALLALEASFPGDRLSARQFRHHLQSPTGLLRVLVTPDNGRLAGYALLLLHRRRRAARLYSLVVDPGCRGRGYGQRLLADIERQARARGCPAVRLEVRADNPAAQALYAAAGYRPLGRRAGYYQDGADALQLEHTLDQCHP